MSLGFLAHLELMVFRGSLTFLRLNPDSSKRAHDLAQSILKIYWDKVTLHSMFLNIVFRKKWGEGFRLSLALGDSIFQASSSMWRRKNDCSPWVDLETIAQVSHCPSSTHRSMSYFWEQKVNLPLSLFVGLKLLGHVGILKSYHDETQELMRHTRSKKSTTPSSEPTKWWIYNVGIVP